MSHAMMHLDTQLQSVAPWSLRAPRPTASVPSCAASSRRSPLPLLQASRQRRRMLYPPPQRRLPLRSTPPAAVSLAFGTGSLHQRALARGLSAKPHGCASARGWSSSLQLPAPGCCSASPSATRWHTIEPAWPLARRRIAVVTPSSPTRSAASRAFVSLSRRVGSRPGLTLRPAHQSERRRAGRSPGPALSAAPRWPGMR